MMRSQKKSMGYDRNMKRCCFKERLVEKRKMVIIVVFSEFFSILSDGVHHGDIISTHTKSNECAFWGPLTEREASNLHKNGRNQSISLSWIQKDSLCYHFNKYLVSLEVQTSNLDLKFKIKKWLLRNRNFSAFLFQPLGSGTNFCNHHSFFGKSTFRLEFCSFMSVMKSSITNCALEELMHL